MADTPSNPSTVYFKDMLLIDPESRIMELSRINPVFFNDTDMYRLCAVVAYVLSEKEKTEKDLKSTRTGHYVSYAYDQVQDTWYYLNDCCVRETEVDITKEKPISIGLLIFVRQSNQFDLKQYPQLIDSDDDVSDEPRDDSIQDFVYSDEEALDYANDFDVFDDELQEKKYLLLPLLNSMKFLDSRNCNQLYFYNLCPYNSAANGFAFAYKTDVHVRRYMTEVSKYSKYFEIIITLIRQPCIAQRAEIWGNFVRSKCKLIDIPYPCDMKGDINVCLEKLMSNHTSVESGQRRCKTVAIQRIDSILINAGKKQLLFPEMLLARANRETRVYREMVIIDGSAISIPLNTIPKQFQYSNNLYRLKFVTTLEARPQVDHFYTFGYEENCNTWWCLDDCQSTEHAFLELTQSVRPMLMVYVKALPERFKLSIPLADIEADVTDSDELSSDYFDCDNVDDESDEMWDGSEDQVPKLSEIPLPAECATKDKKHLLHYYLFVKTARLAKDSLQKSHHEKVLPFLSAVNSVAHGLICAYKNNDVVKKYIDNQRGYSEYFMSLLLLMNMQLKNMRAGFWMGFIMKRASLTSTNPQTLNADIDTISDIMIDAHVSGSTSSTHLKVIDLRISGKLVFPDQIMSAVQKETGKDLLSLGTLVLLSTFAPNTVLDEIPKYFVFGKGLYRLQFVVRRMPFVSNKKGAHYKTYSYVYGSKCQW